MFDVMYARYILTIAAFVIITMMDVLYFSKYRSTNKLKHKMYSYLTIFNTILLISELCIMVVFWNDLSFDTCLIFLKLRDIWLMFYFTMLLFYYYTSVNNLQYDSLFEFLKNEKIVYPHILFTVGVIAIHFFLPYNYMTKYTFTYTFSGTAFYVTIIYCVLTTLETISLVIFKNKGGISFSEKLSLVWLFSLMIVILVLQTIFSGANIMGLISSLYILGLYFIFENPDLELVEEIDALTEEVEKANRTKLDFLSNVSTEMVDPINNIVELSEGILNTKEFDGKKLFDDIKQIELSSKSFLEIVNNTLDISNIESDKDVLYEKDYSLISLLRSLTSIVQEKLANKNVKLVLNVDNSIPSNLHGDSTKIYQILLNIMSNSIKYTDVGRISVYLNKEIKGSTIVLKFKISDTGIGIKKEDFGKIFQKYSRSEEAVAGGTKGTGLGLAVTKKYVDLLGGNIWFDSVHGAGTTFYVEIPQQIVNMRTTLSSFKEMKADDLEQSNVLDCSNYRILIVEDDQLNLEVTKRLFERYGFKIDSCTNGHDCIYKYKKGEQYDMILLDHIMPEMSGVEIMRVIRKLKDYQAPPLVALTANTFSGSEDMFLKEGFDDYLSKPIDMIDLDALINKYFRK